MKILKTVEKLPGGLMLVPLLLGAIINTFAPASGKYFGSFTNGIMHGVVPVLAVWFFCMGASISLKATGTVLRKSGTLVITKIIVAWIVAMVVMKIMPAAGITTGLFAGFSVLSLVAAMDMTNGGLYAALMQQYGSKEEASAFVLMSIESGPLVTMAILTSSGAAYFAPHLFIGAVLPFIVGFILGNLDEDCREFFGRCVVVLIPFFAFSLGGGINLHVILQTGVSGLLLGLMVIIITGIPLIFADKLVGGGNGLAGLAASSTAGAAVATPTLIAQLAPSFAPMAPAATAMVASSVIVTSIVVPILCSMWAKKYGNYKLAE